MFNIKVVDVVRKDLENNGGKGAGSMTETMLDLKEQGVLDTTWCALHNAILTLLTHMHVLSAARLEIDAVVGTQRSPRFEYHLPYCDALVKEVLRWRPVTPLVLPHATIEADVYEGWMIPKVTLVIANTWAINKHEKYLPRPEELAPERYLDETDVRYRPELKGREFPGKFGNSSFGWGRRACAGSDLALASIWIAIVKLIWSLEFVKLDGEAYYVDDYPGGVVLKPKEVRCNFKVWRESHGMILERDLCDAERILEKFLPFE